MATIASDVNLVTREDCYRQSKIMLKEIQDIKDTQNDIKIQLDSLPSKLTLKLDERYADKKTEKSVDKLIWLVLSAVIIAILSLILK